MCSYSWVSLTFYLRQRLLQTNANLATIFSSETKTGPTWIMVRKSTMVTKNILSSFKSLYIYTLTDKCLIMPLGGAIVIESWQPIYLANPTLGLHTEVEEGWHELCHAIVTMSRVTLSGPVWCVGDERGLTRSVDGVSTRRPHARSRSRYLYRVSPARTLVQLRLRYMEKCPHPHKRF